MKRLGMLGVGKPQKGYTIIEALIFLAVSGALLVAAGTTITGRQEKTRFAQGIDDISQNLQDVFNDASTGYYPTGNNIGCTATGGTPATGLNISAISSPQGTNKDCIFIGKVFEFPENSPSYTIYTAVGNTNAPSLDQSIVRLLGKNSTPGISETKSNNIDLEVKKIVHVTPSAPSREYRSIVVLSDFGNISGASVSGNAGKLKLYGYTPSLSSGTVTTSNPDALVPVSGSSYLVLCLEQEGGGDARRGYITVNSQLTVDRIIGSQDPACA